MKKKAYMIADIIIGIFFVFAILLALSARWMLVTWPNLKMSELMYMLSQGFSGTGGAMISSYIEYCAVPTAIAAVMLAGLHFIMRNMPKAIMRTYLILASVLSIAISGAIVYQRIGVGDYVVAQSVDSEFIRDHYADPDKVTTVFPEQKRNLIYIYLESMEVTFADKANGGAFEENTIPELTRLAQETEDFSGNRQQLNGGISLPDTTWTMGAMFAQTSGLPLKTSVDGNTMARQEQFFPGISVLGDVLEDEGYRNILLIGSDAGFAGRDLYFKSHGNYEMHDYVYARKKGLIPSDYYVWWGFEDQKLFAMAQNELNELSSSDQPFNLTILTVDTHFEDGWECEDCPDTFGDNQYANVMACSSKRVMEFIDWCKTQPWYENTAIVLCGDHPTMDTDFCAEVDPAYQRKVYTAYINSAVPNADPDRYRIYSTFDCFPTTLAAMGVFIDGDRLGLGTNLFSGRDTLTEELGLSEESAALWQRSRFMEEVSGIVVHANDYKERGSKLIGADVTAVGYDSENEVLTVNVNDITAGEGRVQNVMLITENDDGRKYYKAAVQADGSFTANLHLRSDQLSSTWLRASAVTKENGKLYGTTLFEYSEANLLYMGTVQDDAAGYLTMIRSLDPEKYTVYMSMKGNAASGVDDEIQNALYALGAETDLRGQDEISYFFVRDDDGMFEQSGTNYLERHGYTSEWRPFYMISAAENTGNVASIMINDGINGFVDYSMNDDGMNFVIWDNEENEAVSRASFDTTKRVPSADISVGEINTEEGTVVLQLKNLQAEGDILKVNVSLTDLTNPENRTAAKMIYSDGSGWTVTLETGKIDLSSCLLRIIALDWSNSPYKLPPLSGSLYEYRAAHPSQIIKDSD